MFVFYRVQRVMSRLSRSSMKMAQRDIAQANSVSDAEFITRYIQPSPDWTQWTHPRTGEEYTLSLKIASLLTDAELTACFDLVHDMSGADYRASSGGWDSAEKRDEMRSLELRYILVKKGDVVEGFTSLMPTFENGLPVVYCYEVQLRPILQGAGMGRRLMELVLSTANNTPSVVKVMLTCFVSNESARRFYERMGFVVDESSPRERRLRSGITRRADYTILSRPVEHP